MAEQDNQITTIIVTIQGEVQKFSQTLVQLIVRNLYERTADVRWWATDEAFYRCLEEATDPTDAKKVTIVKEIYA